MSSIELKFKKRAANYKCGRNREVNVKDILRQVFFNFFVYIFLFLINYKCFHFRGIKI